MTDPFDALFTPPERQEPRPSFTRRLRARLVHELDLAADPTDVPTVDLPERKTMTTTTTTTTTTAPTEVTSTVTPYLTVSDGAAALAWYVEAFGAVETFRVVGDDGRLGHAEFDIGTAHFMLSDEYPEMGVLSPTALGGTSTALHLTLVDVDAVHARAVGAGATALREPEDQSHGNRQSSIVDPYGHRWMLSQPIESFDLDTYAARSEGSGFEVVVAEAGDHEQVVVDDRGGSGGGIWAGVFYADALAGIDVLVDVFGFERQMVVTGPDGTTVVHSQLRWPEGGIVQAGTHDPDNPFTHEPGEQSLYVVTADVDAVWQRCQAAGLEVLRPLETPDYAPDTTGFAVRDPEGNIFSFGSYGLDA